MSTPEARETSTAIIKLMTGVVYREVHEEVWRTLERDISTVRDHFAQIGVDVVVDDTEGYAYLKAREPDEGEDPLPRLVRRRALTYNVSLLLLLLRKRMVEFEASGSEGKLVVERDQMIEMLRVFLRDSSNEARVVGEADRTISQIANLGFLTPLKGQRDAWEVRRILKAYIDAETMADFSGRLIEYAKLTGDADE